MPAILPQGSISPLWREQVVANPAQVSNITAGGASSGTTVTVGTNLVGLQPGVLVTFAVGTPEPQNTIVLSYVPGTGVVTFANPLVNAHASGNLQWGYGAPAYQGAGEFGASSGTSAQGPANTGAQPSPTYGNGAVNPKVRVWDLQLRQQSIYT